MSRYSTFDLKDLENFESVVNYEAAPITYLAIDPGKHSGVCGYDDRYQIHFMYVVAATDMVKFLHIFKNITTCIIEDFKLYPNKAGDQFYSTMETSRVIGRVEHWAELLKVKLIKQGASIKPTGYAWIGKKPPTKSSNMNDPMDAHVHFMYWAIKTGKINARDLLNGIDKKV